MLWRLWWQLALFICFGGLSLSLRGGAIRVETRLVFARVHGFMLLLVLAFVVSLPSQKDLELSRGSELSESGFQQGATQEET